MLGSPRNSVAPLDGGAVAAWGASSRLMKNGGFMWVSLPISLIVDGSNGGVMWVSSMGLSTYPAKNLGFFAD